MKKILLFAALLSFSFTQSYANNGDKNKPNCKKDHPEAADSGDGEKSGNKIVYSSIAGEFLYIETVDKNRRPLSCLMRINNEDKHRFVPENGLITFDRDTDLQTIHVFHDSKVYDFVPKQTEHNKLTLVLNTKNQKYHQYENRVRKIKYDDIYFESKPKKRVMSCGLQADVDFLVSQ